jgi:hypothetical protein
MKAAIPKYIENAGIVGAPVKHKWSEDIAADLAESENGKLQTAIDKTHFKGTAALAAAVAEWTLFRFKELADLSMPLNRIEMMWASVVDAKYGRQVEEIDAEDAGPVEGPISLTLDLLNVVYEKYVKLNPRIAEEVVALATVARHVIPTTGRAQFDSWVTAVLKRLAQSFPMDLSHYNKTTKKYDPSYEKPVPRELFDPRRSVTDAEAPALIQKFVKELDPKRNPFLVIKIK